MKKTEIMWQEKDSHIVSRSPGKIPKIVIAEDDPGILDIFKIIFEDAGYAIQVKSNGRDLLQNKFDLPDLFLVDKQLPGASGLDICRHLKSQEQTKHIPVIIVSAAPDIALLSKEAGADNFIKKPFDIAHLLKLAERYTKHETD